MHPSREEALIEAILGYLSSHPQAADSVDGVTNWWLANHGPSPARAEVEQALTTMVARGLIRRVELPDDTVLYCCHGSPLH